MPNSKPARMTLDEKRLAREMHFERGLAPSRVAEALGRSLSAVVRLLAQKRQPKRVGRPALLSPAQVDKIHKTLTALVDKADGRFGVTVAMVKRRSRVKASERVVSEALHARGVYFRKMREKPISKPEHVRARHAWARNHKNKSPQWWLRNIHVHLDNHHFKIATTHAGRCLLSRRLEGICEAEIELKPPMAGCLHAAGGVSNWLCRRS